MTALLLPLCLAAGMDLAVAGDGCPSRDEISAELDRLATPATGEGLSPSFPGPPLSAEVFPLDDQILAISLRTEAGALLAHRTLPRSGSCADLAAAAAVIITTWEGEIRADLGPELPVSDRGRAAPPGDTLSPLYATVVASPSKAPSALERPWEVGAAMLASRAGDYGAGAIIDAHLGRPRSRLGGRIALLGEGAHALSVGPSPGQARWSRAALQLGLRDRLWLGDFALDGRAQVEAAALRIEGAGFGANYNRTGVNLGLGLGGRLAWSRGHFAPFVAVDAWAWPGRQAVTAAGTGTALSSLPQFELQLAAGISLGRFR